MTEIEKKRKKNIGPRSGQRIPVKVTASEKEAIERTARQVRLPASTLMRNLALGYSPPSRVDQETFLELFSLRGDLGRLGGLLKLWLVDRPDAVVPNKVVREALTEILERQEQVADLIGEMRPLIRR
ncbi:plasmid mobilization protein [Acetobacter orientalis]|uniref:plasmid mobilization protein n=1 Tax=Acetobacter orientalis TaxID=146474 RepID=UPI0039E99928